MGSSTSQKSMLSSLSKKMRFQVGHWWARRMVSSQRLAAERSTPTAAVEASRSASMVHTCFASPPPAIAFTSRAVKYRGRKGERASTARCTAAAIKISGSAFHQMAKPRRL